MEINGYKIEPGETRKLDVNIAMLPSHSPINISIVVSRSVKKGPVLMLAGGLHGDEINGIEIVRRVIEEEINIPSIGTIICIPIINIFGFIHFSRYVPDGKDVNRSFPGNKKGSLASRVAYFITQEILPKIDYGLDFHTGGADRTNYPQTRGIMRDQEVAELARAFGARFSLNAKMRPKSLRWTAAKKGKKILVYEGGESSRLDEFAIEEGVNGVRRLLKYLGMLQGEAPPPPEQRIVLRSSTWIRARISGIFRAKVNLGDAVKSKQVIGYITDPFGDFKVPVKSTSNGFVIGLNNNPILHQGDAIIHVGIV
jgi:predicted deacylase